MVYEATDSQTGEVMRVGLPDTIGVVYVAPHGILVYEPSAGGCKVYVQGEGRELTQDEFTDEVQAAVLADMDARGINPDGSPKAEPDDAAPEAGGDAESDSAGGDDATPRACSAFPSLDAGECEAFQ
ncbi:MAG: hypothetical protein RJQ08_11635 [Salinisphaeraceae bacterium]